ncbi:hypothetical protein BDR04DRAFT_1141228 [Suillus decipiens]|nr:hypothetical protein BDR04DRAFT_1141228 [Suillus decipiens]
MASEVADDSKSVKVFNAPPPYSTTSTSAPTDATAEFSDLLQTLNIEGHTALYWAILNLGKANRCPSDEVQVDSGDGLVENQFVAHFRIKKFQKRIRITYDVNVEFVARGRICISEPNLPAHPACVIMIAAHKKPGCEVPPEGLQFGGSASHMLVKAPDEREEKYDGKPIICWEITDWLVDDNTKYVDSDGTLHVKMEMTLK